MHDCQVKIMTFHSKLQHIIIYIKKKLPFSHASEHTHTIASFTKLYSRQDEDEKVKITRSVQLISVVDPDLAGFP